MFNNKQIKVFDLVYFSIFSIIILGIVVLSLPIIVNAQIQSSDYLIYSKNGTYYANSTNYPIIQSSSNFSSIMQKAINNDKVYGKIDVLGNVTVTNEIQVNKSVTINVSGLITSNTASGKGVFNLKQNDIIMNLFATDCLNKDSGRHGIVFTWGKGIFLTRGTTANCDVSFWLPMNTNKQMYDNFFHLGLMINNNWGIRSESSTSNFTNSPQGNYFDGSIQSSYQGSVLLQCGIPYSWYLSTFNLQIDNAETSGYDWQHCNNDRIMTFLNINRNSVYSGNIFGNQDHGIINFANATSIK